MGTNPELIKARPIYSTVLLIALAAVTPLVAKAQSPEPQRTPQAQNQAPEPGLVLGARVPIILTSRADSVRSRIASCAIAMLAAQARRNKPGKIV